MSLAINKIITWALIIAAIIAVVVGFSFLYPKIAFAFTEMPEEIKENVQNNFDSMNSNFEKCRNMQDNGCLCEVFPGFPASFTQNNKLYLTEQGKDMKVELIYENKVYFTQVIPNILITGVLIENQQLNFDKVKNEIDIYGKKWIDFSGNPLPTFNRQGLNNNPGVMSGFVYKNQDKLYLLLSYQTKEQTDSFINTLKKCVK